MARHCEEISAGELISKRGRPRKDPSEDVWFGIEDPQERKRRQDRLAQRARRQRISARAAQPAQVDPQQVNSGAGTHASGIVRQWEVGEDAKSNCCLQEIDPQSGQCETEFVYEVPFHCCTWSESSPPCGSFDDGSVMKSLGRSVSPVAMYREQMFADFLTAYCSGKDTAGRNQCWLKTVPTSAASTPLFTRAIETISFAYTGRIREDNRMTQMAGLAYADVLQSLKQSMQRSPSKIKAGYHRDVLLAMLTINMVGTFDVHNDTDAWMTHWKAAQQFAALAGPSAFDMTDHLTVAMLVAVFSAAIMLGLACREALPMGQGWTDPAMWDRPGLISVYESKCQWPVVASLPEILERTDTLLEQDGVEPYGKALRRLCCDIESMRQSISADAEETLDNAARRVIYVTDSEMFNANIEEHRFITSSSTIGWFHEFEDLHALSLCIRFSVCQLVLTCTLLRLMNFKPEVNLFPDLLPAAVLKREAYGLAINLCRSVYQVALLESPARSMWLRKCLLLARNVFEEHEAFAEMSWCQACLFSIRVHDLRMLSAHGPKRPFNLCRVATLPAAFAEAGRYSTDGLLSGSGQTTP